MPTGLYLADLSAIVKIRVTDCVLRFHCSIEVAIVGGHPLKGGIGSHIPDPFIRANPLSRIYALSLLSGSV
jgi:hypothetical protein